MMQGRGGVMRSHLTSLVVFVTRGVALESLAKDENDGSVRGAGSLLDSVPDATVTGGVGAVTAIALAVTMA